MGLILAQSSGEKKTLQLIKVGDNRSRDISLARGETICVGIYLQPDQKVVDPKSQSAAGADDL